jgi:hypothetical protein
MNNEGFSPISLRHQILTRIIQSGSNKITSLKNERNTIHNSVIFAAHNKVKVCNSGGNLKLMTYCYLVKK